MREPEDDLVDGDLEPDEGGSGILYTIVMILILVVMILAIDVCCRQRQAACFRRGGTVVRLHHDLEWYCQEPAAHAPRGSSYASSYASSP